MNNRNKGKTFFAIALSAVMGCMAAIPALWTGAEAEESTVADYVCETLELRDGRGGEHIDYSSIDGISLQTFKGTYTGEELTVTVNIGTSDWSGAGNVYLRLQSVSSMAVLFAAKIADKAGNFFWLKGNDYVSELGGSNAPAEGIQSVLNADFNGFVKFDLGKLEKIAGAGDALALDSIAVMQFTFYYSQQNKANIGDVYIDSGNDYVKVYDAAAVSENNGYSLAYGGGDAGTLKANSRVGKIRKDEVKLYDNTVSQWQQLYAVIPSDISAYNGVSYYVDNSVGEDELFFNKCLREAGGEHWYVDGTAMYAVYIPEEGESYIGNANIVPAGYKGTIVVPFSDFTTRAAEGTAQNNVQDFGAMFARLEFAFDTANNDYPSDNFFIRNVKLVSDARQFWRTVQEVSDVGDVKIVNPFEYKDDFDLSMDWNIQWSLSATAEISVVENPSENAVGVSGKAMKISCGSKTDVPDANQDVCVQWSLNAGQSDANGAKGITYWIKNTSYSQIGFRVEFDSLVDGEAQRWASRANCRYMLFNTKTGTETVCMGKSGVYVPKDFEGYVRIDFSQFDRPNWVTVGGDFSDANPIGTTYIINSTYHQGDSFLFDSFGWYYSDVDVTTTFHTPENSFTAAMNGDYFNK